MERKAFVNTGRLVANDFLEARFWPTCGLPDYPAGSGVALWKKWPFAVKLANAAFAAGAMNSVIAFAVLVLIGFVHRPPASVLSGVGPWLGARRRDGIRPGHPVLCSRCSLRSRRFVVLWRDLVACG